MRISREEIFGPVAAVIRVKDYDEALAAPTTREFGLSAGIVHHVAEVCDALQAQCRGRHGDGQLPTAGVDFHVPFGGRKGSSYGPREQGKLCGRVLHHGEDRLHCPCRHLCRAAWWPSWPPTLSITAG
jgi:acyl-CoA reductase-like NAD-dependent aldehyde dehydrogenase